MDGIAVLLQILPWSEPERDTTLAGWVVVETSLSFGCPRKLH